MKRRGGWLAMVVGVVLGGLVAGGCALNPEVRTTTEDNAALIFGFYDMSEAPYQLGCVRITQDERAGIAHRQSCMRSFSDGVFFIENVPPMKYHVPFFYASGKLHLISSDSKDAFDVPPRSLYFLGAYKYKVLYRNLADFAQLKPEQYGLNPMKSPNEAAVLKMLMEKVEDPRWKDRIKVRLAQLKG